MEGCARPALVRPGTANGLSECMREPLSDPVAARLKEALLPTVPLPELAALFPKAGLPEAEAFPELLPPLAAYLEVLMQWNGVMNLVGARTWQDAFCTLIVDSFHLASFLEAGVRHPSPRCWDLGAGGGIPGVVLRMLWRKGEYWLVEAREKRALFLAAVLARCPLPGVRVFRGRAEAFMAGPPPRKADLVVSRAFMPWRDVLALVRHGLARDGRVVFLLKEPLAESPCPGWRRTAQRSYAVGGDTRFVCALVPVPQDTAA